MFTACGLTHRRSCLLVTRSPANNFYGALNHKLQTQSSAPEDGRNYHPKHVELIQITNKLLMLHLFSCLYYCIRCVNCVGSLGGSVGKFI